MSWDQQIGRQDVQSFLLSLLEVDPNELLRQVIEQKLAEVGLSYEVEEDLEREEGDGLVTIFNPRRITLSDGRVFVETVVEEVRSDDWGSDFYGFIEAGKSYKVMKIDYNGDDNEPSVTEEVIPGTEAPLSLEEMREQGNALSPGMGDSVADFFASQGIETISFEPGDDE